MLLLQDQSGKSKLYIKDLMDKNKNSSLMCFSLQKLLIGLSTVTYYILFSITENFPPKMLQGKQPK